MTPMIERLRGLPFFRALSETTFRAIIDRGLWFSLAGGWELFAQGSNSQTVYFVVSGRLVVVRETSGGDEVIGYVRAGEPVGEMSMLSGEAHSASVYALRDTEIIALPRADFDSLLEESSDLAVALSRLVLYRARHPGASSKQSAPRVFALIATSPSINPDDRAQALIREVRRYGLRARAIGEADADEQYVAFEETENENDIVILAARMSESSWYQFALRHADRYFLLARRDARPPRPMPLTLEGTARARRFRLVDLVMVEEGAPSAGVVADWIDAVGANRVFHWKGAESLRHIARVMAGKSIGLVFSGGGARAYAHIGVVRAMREMGIPIDFVSGASMGAIVAACVAMGWNDDEIEMRIRDAFVKSNPLGDHVLPVVALTRGRLVEDRLKTHFGEALIEELDTPFFCVSSDLAIGSAKVHRLGLIREALRATISLPGILPPVVDDGALLVDGAVINNFPLELMAAAHRGPTIGVDVALRGTINPNDFVNPPSFFQWVWDHGFKTAPPIISLLMRAATTRKEPAKSAHPADIMIIPTIEGVELRDWKKYDIAVAAGYQAGKKELQDRWEELAPICEAAKG